MSPAETPAKLSSDRRFVWLKRNLTPREQQDVNSLGIPGVHFMDEWKRIYPQGSLTAHVVGYTDVDDRGIAGVETSFDDVLRGGHEPLQLARSEEHTSELQSLMRISYAVFCFKK